MLKKRLLSLGMVLCILAATGCAAQKEPAQPDGDKQVENTPHAASPEPTQMPTPEVTTAPTAEPEPTAGPENIFDRIPTEGNVWKINEIEREYGLRGHSSPDWDRIFHEMTREEVLTYFGMELDLSDILPELQESPDDKYGFYEFPVVYPDKGPIAQEDFSYRSDEEWARYVTVSFKEGGLPEFTALKTKFSEEFRNYWEPEVSVVQGQEVRIVHLTVKYEEEVHYQYYLAEFMDRDLGVTVVSGGVEWEDVKKVIEYLVFYAQEREGG